MHHIKKYSDELVVRLKTEKFLSKLDRTIDPRENFRKFLMLELDTNEQRELALDFITKKGYIV